LELVQQLSKELHNCVAPKSIYGIWGCHVDPPTVTLGNMTIQSKDLSRHLGGSCLAVLLAATLGSGADTLIRHYSTLDMEKAVIAQAICTAMIETYCDHIESELIQRPEAEGLFLTTRFSPGYGDFDIIHQKDILQLLDAGKRIGLTLTDGYMLAPSKSVIAVIGFTAEKNCGEEKCANCDKKDCEFRILT
jgi:hypothetical protein